MAPSDSEPSRSHTTPAADPGLTELRCPHPRSGALHRVALQTTQETAGETLWIDARNTVATYALREAAPAERLLDRLQIARAFTAYQHFGLAERAITRTRPGTGCLVVPNVASLYRDEDVPGHEAVDMLEAVLASLRTVGETYDIPVVVSTTEADGLRRRVADEATAEIRCVETDLGYRFEGDAVEVSGYWCDGYWQTTVPYWVELFGPVDRSPAPAAAEPDRLRAVEG